MAPSNRFIGWKAACWWHFAVVDPSCDATRHAAEILLSNGCTASARRSEKGNEEA